MSRYSHPDPYHLVYLRVVHRTAETTGDVLVMPPYQNFNKTLYQIKRNYWLPPGDVRNCMVALAENDNALKRILDFRFDRGDLAGHSLGNLLLLAVTEMCGDFRVAVEQMNQIPDDSDGNVFPVKHTKKAAEAA